MFEEKFYNRLCTIQENIDGFKTKMFQSSNDQKYDVLKEIYAYLKEEEARIITNKAQASAMRIISNQVWHLSDFLPSESLIRPKPYHINQEQNLKMGADIEDFLAFLVNEDRKRLFNIAQEYGYKTLEDFDPLAECQDSAVSIYNMAISMGLNAKVKIIEPGYIYDSPLYLKSCKHCVVIIYYNGKMYLIDTTYLQFFMVKRCLLEVLGVIYMPSANPGAYMIMDQGRRKTAEKILNDGWMEMTPENIKNYFDGFTMFYRNGLYYEKTLDFSFNPIYTAKDYLRFLGHLDDQTYHEDIDCLGYQTRALKNPKMQFYKR